MRVLTCLRCYVFRVRRFGGAAEGSGSMTNVNALSGRVGDVAFSILSDSCPVAASTVRAGIDEIAVLFAELP